MKNILCFGDSNVFGFNPKDGTRFDKDTRWTGILTGLLGRDYSVTEGGCNNRTCFKDNPAGELFTGYRILPKLLEKKNYDIIILSVGTNDVQKSYNTSVDELGFGIRNLINIAKEKSPDSRIIIIIPQIIKACILNSFFVSLFDKTSIELSITMPAIYRHVAEEMGCEYVDFNGSIESSDIDGLHFDEGAHKQIAEKLFELIN